MCNKHLNQTNMISVIIIIRPCDKCVIIITHTPLTTLLMIHHPSHANVCTTPTEMNWVLQFRFPLVKNENHNNSIISSIT